MNRCLFGPAPATFAPGDLAPSEALLFDFDGKQALALPADADWNSVAARFPSGWEPDFLLLSLSYASIPFRLFDCPVPIIGLAPDWNLLWSCYRHVLPRVDVAFTDSVGVEHFARAGFRHVRPGNQFGLEASMLSELGSLPAVERDIDVLFVGNCQPAVQRERLQWLGRLAALSQRWNIVIGSGVCGPEYWKLLKRAKIVFNRSIRGECNRRVFEAVAAGSLLLQESENREVASLLKAGSEYAGYDAGNLEAVIEHYLTHDDERQAITDAAGRRVNEFTFSALWQRALSALEPEWGQLRERARQRAGRKGRSPEVMAGAWSAVAGGGIGEVAAALREAERSGQSEGKGLPQTYDVSDLGTLSPLTPTLSPQSRGEGVRGASPHFSSTSQSLEEKEARTLAAAARANAAGLFAPNPAAAADCFAEALAHDPRYLVAGLNRAEALARMGRTAEAAAQGHQTLALLESGSDLPDMIFDAPHYPPGFDLLGVEWERAGWRHAGDPHAEREAKRALLRLWLHLLLADLTGNLSHYSGRPASQILLPTFHGRITMVSRGPSARPPPTESPDTGEGSPKWMKMMIWETKNRKTRRQDGHPLRRWLL